MSAVTSCMSGRVGWVARYYGAHTHPTQKLRNIHLICTNMESRDYREKGWKNGESAGTERAYHFHGTHSIADITLNCHTASVLLP